MKKYIYQKFLLNCNYELISLSGIPLFKGCLSEIQNYGESYSIFDIGKSIIRKLQINVLDDMIDTEDDWKEFVKSIEEIDELVLYDVFKDIKNPILNEYRQATIRAYIYRLQEEKIKVSVQ